MSAADLKLEAVIKDVQTEMKACLIRVETLTKEFEKIKAEIEASNHAMNSMSDTVKQFILALTK